MRYASTMTAGTTTLGKLVLLCLSLLVLAQQQSVWAQECDVSGKCDTHERCKAWHDEGECTRNKEYMSKHCPISCKDGDRNLLKANAGECKDLHPRCSVWQQFGECDSNSEMRKYCRQSCGLCQDKSYVDEDDLCVDTHETCAFWASKGECVANPGFMEVNCAMSCDTCDKLYGNAQNQRQTAEADDAEAEELMAWSESVGVRQSAIGEQRANTLNKIRDSRTYWEDDATKALPADLLGRCRNSHDLCSFWAHLGECEANESYMAVNCGPACHTCHLIDIGVRCPPLENPRPALRAGYLNKMFERIVREAPGNRTADSLTSEEKKIMEELKMPMYTVTVHSRPSEEPATEVSAVNDKSLPPWVIQFDNFMTNEECEEMIQLGYKYEYKRSEDVGEEKHDGTFGSVQSERRTSENAWCSTFAGCRDEELPSLMHRRIGEVLGIPPENSEDFQVLRYREGQFYRTHHDYIPHQKDRQCGPRILTFFMYLSDVEEGGGTNFPQLNITVQPKRGRAVLWPSVYDSDPMKSDSRFHHQALSVGKGVKYAFNGWIHMYDYVGPQAKGCN